MKRKLKGVLGIGLTLVLLVSLTAGLAVPAAADPGKLKFTTLILPKVGEAGDYWAMPGSDVGAIDVSADGDTLFAAVDVEDTSWQLMKSTDGGYAWKVLEGFREEADTDVSPIVDVVVSPDYEEDLTVFVATKNFLYQSVDGGKKFVQMTTGWSDAETITDLDVALDERGRLAIMVGTWTGLVPVGLGASDGNSATWSTAQAHSGSYSALLDYDTGDNAYVEFTPSPGITFGDLATITTDWSFWYYLSTSTNGPILELRFEGPNFETDFEHVDITVNTAELTATAGLWQKVPVTSSSTATCYGNDADGIAFYDWFWSPGVSTGNYTLAQLVTGVTTTLGLTGAADWPLTRVRVELGWIGSARDAYIDDITINDVTYHLEEDGVADVYVLSTATGMSWQAQGVGAYDVLAVGFSPFFADDEGIAAVVTDSVKTRVTFSFAYIGADDPSLGWGVDIGDANVQDAVGADFASTHARIGFPDDFDPWGIGNNICFVGIYAGTTGDPDLELGDVYEVVLKSVSSAIDLDIRGVITTLQPTATNIVSIDVCGDAEEASILVGTDYCSLLPREAYFLVYRSDDGGETWIPSGTKSPTGGTDGYVVFEDAWTRVLMSPDFLTDEIAYAATTGPGTSAFSRSDDSAATWNQISLIDYGDVEDGYVIVDLDAAGYNVDGTLHMTTQVGGTYGAVWNRTGGKNWERIWSYANPAVYDDISELIINGDETMFAVDYAAEKMWRSSDMGATWPKTITTKADLTEVCIVSPTTLYTGHTDGGIYWSTKSGTAWKKPDVNPNKDDIFMIAVKGDYVLVSNEYGSGKVYFSSDGGENFERVGVTDPGKAGRAVAVYDLGFAENNIIYCVISMAWPFDYDAKPFDQVGDAIYRTELDIDDPSSSEWVSIDDIAGDEQGTVVYLGPALTLPPSGVLYATDGAEVDADKTKGGLWRCTNPTADVDSPVPPYFERENKGLDEDDKIAFMDLDVFPTTLFFTNQWGLPFITPTVPYYEQIVMFTDTLDSGVSLADPGDGAAGVGIIPDGAVSAALKLAWKGMAGATSYQYQVAIDSDFMSVVESGFTSSLVTPTLSLSPNKTYYWRVRVANEVVPTAAPKYLIGAPLISPWSETWKFKTAIGATMARPDLEAPAAGEIDIALRPTFEWSGIAWAEKYEFELATGPSTTAGGYFADVLVGLTGANALVSTAWKCDIDLDYNSRYYWHVKAIGVDTETPWSDVGTFTTMAVPAEPVEPVTPVVIPPVEEITPAWIWAIIGIGAALVIAVIVLVVTTRRVP